MKEKHRKAMYAVPARYRDFDPNRVRKPLPPWLDRLRRAGIHLGFLHDGSPRLAWKDVAAMYERPPSFAGFLPIRYRDPETSLFILQDYPGVAAVMELSPVDAEARSLGQLENMLVAMVSAFGVIPQRPKNPWIAQFYLQDEPLIDASRKIREYAGEIGAPGDRFTGEMLDVMRDHLIDIGRPGGIFEDTHTGVRWGGRQRRCRLVLYRRFEAGEYRDGDIPEIGGRRPIRELDELARNLAHGLDAAGIASRRIGAGEYTNWLMPWLTPLQNRRDAWDWLAEYGEEPDHVYPVTRDLAWGVMNHMPISDTEFGTWNFCGLPHRYLPVTGFLREPRPGLLTLEGTAGRGRAAAFFDRLPPATVFCQQVIFVPQDQVAAHLRFIERRSLSDSAESRLVRTQVEECQGAMARGHVMFPMTMGLYLRGENLEELNDRLDRVHSLCKQQGLDPVRPESCVFPLDEYVRNLPVGWHPDYDRYLFRQRYDWLMNAVAASPLWGKGGGSGRPGFTFFDRAGQPVQLDILHPEDRDRAPHCLIVGPTGTGKSALLNYLALQVMALRRPHLYIIDVGDSFRLLGDYLREHGLSVNHVRLDRGDVSLPPFAGSARMLEQDSDIEAGNAADGTEPAAPDPDDGYVDYIGEMEAAARMILTGLEPAEEKRYVRRNRAFVRAALVDAAILARDRGDPHATVTDFVNVLGEYGNGRTPQGFNSPLDEATAGHVQTLYASAMLFLDGTRDRIFNRYGDPWPEVDCTIIDFGKFAKDDDTRDIVSIAFVSLMNTIQRDAERRRGSGRQSVVMIDEAHVTTTNPLLASYLVSGSKMWRKWGLWLWMATQSLSDFPNDTRQMLNMAEFWFCLSMPREEIAEIARFRRLSEEDQLLLEEARKSPKRYSEGVLLSGRPPILFRNVPPAIAMALAQTEESEVAERHRLMEEEELATELEAVDLVAERIRQGRLS